jgi:tetratricopeptide (TPR) repeat protein
MKKIIILFCFLASIQTAFTQKLNADSIIQKIAAEKDEDKKVDLIFSFYSPGFDANPAVMIEEGQALLKQSEKNKDILLEASAYCFIGFGYRLAGNFIKALEYHQKSLALAEEFGNFSILAMAKNQMGHIYRDREEYDEGLKLYSSALFDSERGKNNMVKAWPLMNIGSMYFKMSKPDSALSYLQRSYELTLKYDTLDLSYVLWNLGGVHSLMGNAALATTYYNMSIQKAIAGNRIRQLNWAYFGLAEHYQRMNQSDSCIFYAKKSIAAVQNTAFSFMSIQPARLLTDMYEKINCDSTLKYTAIYKVANDSLYSKKANQQIQLMTFDEDLRQQEIAAEKIQAEEQRKQNIQYALLALGIITFIILFLMLSRKHITNTKLIQFLGVVALLLVFEFLNLLLHPFLERITYHSPVLMLLALVCIAALLVPLHHKLEKWATHKLVEKNKQIRLAAAKKTIEELEKNNS